MSSPNMRFADVFRHTKVASLPRIKHSYNANTVPKSQVITTHAYGRRNGEYGLKAPLPLGRNSRSLRKYVVVNELDTPEGYTDYSSGMRFASTLKRLRHMHQPVQTAPVARHADEVYSGGLSALEVVSPLGELARPKREEKLSSVLSTMREQDGYSTASESQTDAGTTTLSLSSSLSTSAGEEEEFSASKTTDKLLALSHARKPMNILYAPSEVFPTLDTSFNTAPLKYDDTIKTLFSKERIFAGTAGLSYALFGRAHQTRAGIKFKSAFPGRIVRGPNRPRGLLAGVVSWLAVPDSIRHRRQSYPIYEQMFPVNMEVLRLSLTPDADIKLAVATPLDKFLMERMSRSSASSPAALRAAASSNRAGNTRKSSTSMSNSKQVQRQSSKTSDLYSIILDQRQQNK
ncbi:mitochondrial 37S ribosomal protein bS1m [Lipomyces oligophaga]|uniref:mitochondrial 37S ribosomal protein bS1m n=1 Tax=Lipomyces oligophaga TaxID=45792 RepID=UPI0034CD31F2